uniref:Kinesin motor domain-containing protein n=1 Tax=Macrostomum lignano TaxID=282301 RepID=A0A1I8IZE8_9PLAT
MKVIVKVVSKETGGAACMSADSRRRQVTVFDPAALHHHRQPAPPVRALPQAGQSKLAPKLFSFDALFYRARAASGVVSGSDGCVSCSAMAVS